MTGLADGLRVPPLASSTATRGRCRRPFHAIHARRQRRRRYRVTPDPFDPEAEATKERGRVGSGDPTHLTPPPPTPHRHPRQTLALIPVDDRKVPATVGGAQAGTLLAFLSSAILGQYDPFTPDPGHRQAGRPDGRGPNIISVERTLQVVPSDFRLWVCLHEVTHRVQFSANPWLRQYMTDNIERLTADAGSRCRRSSPVSPRPCAATSPVKGHHRRDAAAAVARAVQAFSRMMMLGTLLEGHADHVMDAVGPAHVPTVAAIREAFDTKRTARQSPLQRIFRALIGMDAKMAQYVRGKAFVDRGGGHGRDGAFQRDLDLTGDDAVARRDRRAEKWIQRVL